ncbi:hypothetical protein [Coleofasciculus sp. E2-BRE-01]
MVQFSWGTHGDRDRGNVSPGDEGDRLERRPYQIPDFFKKSGI